MSWEWLSLSRGPGRIRVKIVTRCDGNKGCARARWETAIVGLPFRHRPDGANCTGHVPHAFPELLRAGYAQMHDGVRCAELTGRETPTPPPIVSSSKPSSGGGVRVATANIPARTNRMRPRNVVRCANTFRSGDILCPWLSWTLVIACGSCELQLYGLLPSYIFEEI